MKTFRILGMALVAVMLGFAMSACSDDDDEYMKELEKEYARLIVGQWFDFTPEASMFMNYQADGSFYMVGYGSINGWREYAGTYKIDKNKAILDISGMATPKLVEIDEITNDRFVQDGGLHTSYRVKEQFDITGKYTYLNSAVRIEAAAGKSELKLPEGITIGGKNTVSVETMNGERIVEQMQANFADAMFTPNAKLRHTVDGSVMYKDYALDGNNLSFELNKGYQVNATSFPDEDGDRLFIIIPKQEAWVGGLADVIRKENPSIVLTDETIAALEKEFMDTFETFTVVLSLSKTGEYNAEEDVNPYEDYAELIVGKWYSFTPEGSMFHNIDAAGNHITVGFVDKTLGWLDLSGTYRIEGNKLIDRYIEEDGSLFEVSNTIEVTEETFTYIGGTNSSNPEIPGFVAYRVKETFDITGKYTYLNSAVRVVAKEGKSELKLPEGITFGGKTSISVEALNGERIVEQMKAYFADAMFTPNAKLRHTVDGSVMYKDYKLEGNSLSLELNKGYQLDATSFPDEDGDRLFIIIPKQEAWIGGLADAIRKENPANVLTDEVIAALETEFMNTFETFTVVLSLSKTGEYNAAEDVDPYKDYAELVVGKWFNFTPEASVYMEFKTDGTYHVAGYDIHASLGFVESVGTYSLDGNNLTTIVTSEDGSQHAVTRTIEVTKDEFIDKIISDNSGSSDIAEKVNYRVKESFDIKGSYTHLNAVAKIIPVEEKTVFQLPEGITFEGANSIPIETLLGERILEKLISFFSEVTFAADGKLEHKIGDETKHKNYTHEGNSLVFYLYEGNEDYKVNATAFPDEDGDRLFIIMPKQGVWIGGFVELIEKENEGLKMTETQIKELENEFMATFETFTLILSLNKK